MAYTYSKIASVTVGSGGSSSIDFIAIPQNYTDLLVKFSLRNTRSSTGPGYGQILINASTSNFSSRSIYVNEDNTIGSNSRTNNYIMFSVATDAQTANTFGSAELYIPNYSASINKSMSFEETSENNAILNVNRYLSAILWSNTAAINSITISAETNTFKQYSTATLYGIKAEV